MNTRFFCRPPKAGSAAGADLTPPAGRPAPGREAPGRGPQFPTRRCRRPCDAHNPAWHAKYKAWCDEYFLFLPHRNEPRGIGGIFYDRHNFRRLRTRLSRSPRDVGEALLDVYPKIARRRNARALDPWPSATKQLMRPRPLCRVQPALRPRHHHVRAKDRRQYRDHPVVHARRWCAGRKAGQRRPLS